MDGTGVEKSRQFPGQLGRSAEMKGPEMGPEPAATPDDQGLHAPEQGVANCRRRHPGDWQPIRPGFETDPSRLKIK